jgi:glucans biosynthesis protein
MFRMTHVDRRLALTGGAAFAIAGSLAQDARAQSVPVAAAETYPFAAHTVTEMARELARRPYQAQNASVPPPFANLSYDQYLGIQPRPEAALWADDARRFTIEPLHRGFVFTSQVALHVVEEQTGRRLSYEPQRFSFSRMQPPQAMGDIGFSGFRVIFHEEGQRREAAIFQGATFFRSLARGQNLGVLARALSLRVAEPRGEEFPNFRAFWLERPAQGATALVIHGLCDSESLTGAFRFTLRPGDVTLIDTEATLFTRTAIDHVGIATMQGTFLHAANDRRGVDDLRPAVHETNGLQILNGAGEWIWRPLNNPDRLQISSFMDNNPKGFGLLQRERDENAYLDDEQLFERRPSLWIEPIGDWGPGSVHLVEIPSESDIHDNVICYWRPKESLAANQEVRIAYRQFWCWTPPEKPPLATVTATRVGRATGNTRGKRRFAVDFQGDALFPASGAPSTHIRLEANLGTASLLRSLTVPRTRTMRVLFELDPAGESAVELRLRLEVGGKPLTETWLYRWTP